MSSWGMVDSNTSVPLWSTTAIKLEPTRANANVIFANANVSYGQSTSNNMAVGIFGVNTQEATNTQVSLAAGKFAHAGWVQRTAGMGAVLSISANSGAYGTNSFVTFTNGGTGSTVANATVAVNSSGAVTSVTVNSGGLYLSTPTAKPVSGNAAFTVTMNGRANRVQYETLVAASSMVGSNSDGTLV